MLVAAETSHQHYTMWKSRQHCEPMWTHRAGTASNKKLRAPTIQSVRQASLRHAPVYSPVEKFVPPRRSSKFARLVRRRLATRYELCVWSAIKHRSPPFLSRKNFEIYYYARTANLQIYYDKKAERALYSKIFKVKPELHSFTARGLQDQYGSVLSNLLYYQSTRNGVREIGYLFFVKYLLRLGRPVHS